MKSVESKSVDAESDSSNIVVTNFQKDIPSVKLSYQGHAYSMLPFVVVEGQDVNKLNFPQLPDDTQPIVKIAQGQAFTVEFGSKPREANAFVIDYDADITTINPVKILGVDTFSIS